MSVMATSGISATGGVENAASGIAGEMVMFLFMFFALSRLTFSSDTVTAGQGRLDKDPEFRTGLLIVFGVPLLLFLRHWVAAYEVDAGEDLPRALHALWGTLFTVMSFLSTTGFESVHWEAARSWSGLETPGMKGSAPAPGCCIRKSNPTAGAATQPPHLRRPLRWQRPCPILM